MSSSVRPHRRKPTRLPRPWDSLGKNTGVGRHFLLQCVKGKSESEVTQSCPILSDPMDCSLPGSAIHGIFQARVLEWGAIAFSETVPVSSNSKMLQLVPSFGKSSQPLKECLLKGTGICEIKACLINQREQTILEHPGNTHFCALRKNKALTQFDAQEFVPACYGYGVVKYFTNLKVVNTNILESNWGHSLWRAQTLC